MSNSTSLSRRKMLGVAAVGAAGIGLAAAGASPALAAAEYGDALDLLVRARDELMEGGREPARYEALRHVNIAIHETLNAMRQDARWNGDPRFCNPRYQRWDDDRFRY